MKQLLIICAASFILCLSSCKEKMHEKIIRPVKVMEVHANAFMEKTFPGYAEAEEYAFLTFRVSGMLLSLNVEEGQDVKSGQLVATLDTRDYQLKASAAKANYQQSQSQLERYKRLYEKNAVSKQEYEVAQATFENNKSIYNQSLNDLNYTSLYAPFAGNVEKKFVENHQQVMPGEKIVKLNNPQKIQYRIVLPETTMQYTGSDFKYSIELDIQKGVFYNAKVKEVVSSSIGGSGVPVILTIDDAAYNSQKVKVLPGYTCNVKVELKAKPQNNIIAIPLVCIYTNPKNNKPYVWKVNKADATVHLSPVELGSLFGEKDIIVLSGVEQGDNIVTAGVTMLADGERVKIMEP